MQITGLMQHTQNLNSSIHRAVKDDIATEVRAANGFACFRATATDGAVLSEVATLLLEFFNPKQSVNGVGSSDLGADASQIRKGDRGKVAGLHVPQPASLRSV